MPGDLSFLDAARDPRPEPRSEAAKRYLARAEEALALLPRLTSSDEKAAVCGIAETWLSLAETELTRPAPPEERRPWRHPPRGT